MRFRPDEGGPMVPPHSIEAEQAVLGALLLVPKAWDEIADMLDAEDFYRHDHQGIWRAIHAKATATPPEPFDTVTLGTWFETHGRHDASQLGAYLVDLSTTTPSAANIVGYAEIVAEKSRMRRVIEVATAATASAFRPEGRTSLDVVGQAQTEFGKLLSKQPCELESMGPLMLKVFERLQERVEADGGVHGLTTSIDELDDLIGGLMPGGLYLLAARPKMGKTTLAQNIAEHVAIEKQLAVAVFSFEMQPEELGDRMLSSRGGVDGNRIRRGELEDEDWAGITAAIKQLRGAQIYVSRPRSARVDHVCAQIRRQHAKTPLGLVIIDYLQLMETLGDNKAQGYGEITRALKLLAGELRIPVLLLSQLNRELEKRTDKHPIPSDLRDSGAIEQDCDALIFIYRDEIYNKSSHYKGTAEIIVALQRNGPPGEVRVRYQPALFKFSNLERGWMPEHPESEEGSSQKPKFKKGGHRSPGGNDA